MDCQVTPFNSLGFTPIETPSGGCCGTSGGCYDLYPNGTDQTAELLAAIILGNGRVSVAPGTLYISKAAADNVAIRIRDISVTIDLNGGKIVQTWNPADPESYGGGFFVEGGAFFAVVNGTYDVSPKVTTQGYCTTISGTAYYEMAIPPEQEPAFTTMDLVMEVRPLDKGNYALPNFRYKLGGDAVSHPIVSTGAVDAQGWKIYRVTPPMFSVAPTNVVSYNPLILRLPMDAIPQDEVTTGSGFTGAWVPFLNGTVRMVLVDDDTRNQVQIVDANGNAINASVAAGAPLDGGTFAVPPVPSWMTEGMPLVSMVQKRMGRPFTIRGTGEVKFDRVRFNSSPAVGIYLLDIGAFPGSAGDVYLDVTFKPVNGGYISCNGGPIQTYNMRGKFWGPGYDVTGAGDDSFNPRTRCWDRHIVAYDNIVGWYDVAFATTNSTVNQIASVTMTRVGDVIEVNDDERNETIHKIASMGPSPDNIGTTRVYLTPPPPAGYVPTTADTANWTMMNRSTVATVDMDHAFSMGIAARGLQGQTHSLNIRHVRLIGCRGSAVRSISPANGGIPFDGGFKGGHHYGQVEIQHAVYNYRDLANSAMIFRVQTLKNQPINKKMGWEPIYIDNLIVDDANYSGLHFSGVDGFIGNTVFRNMGAMRDTLAPGKLGLYDTWVRYSDVRMGGPVTSALSAFEDTGGRVLTTQGPSSPVTLPETAIANDQSPAAIATNKRVFGALSNGQRVSVPAGQDYSIGVFDKRLVFEGDGSVNGIPLAQTQIPIGVPIVWPTAFPYNPPFVCTYDGSRWRTQMDERGLFDVARSRMDAAHVFVDPTAPEAGADGTREHPYPSITAGVIQAANRLSASVAAVLHIQADVYNHRNGWRAPEIGEIQKAWLGAGNVTIVGEDWQERGLSSRRAYCLNGSQASDTTDFAGGWTDMGGGKWQATTALPVVQVLDARERAGFSGTLMRELSPVATLGDLVRGSSCATRAGDVTTITVWLDDDRLPDEDCWVLMRDQGCSFQWPRVGGSLYVSFVDILGPSPDGIKAITPPDTGENSYGGTGSICFADCAIGYDDQGSAFNIENQYLAVYLRCSAKAVYDDLFSWHNNPFPRINGVPIRPIGIAIDCYGTDAGNRSWWKKTEGNNSNVLTTHDGMIGIFVNCGGGMCQGPLSGGKNSDIVQLGCHFLRSDNPGAGLFVSSSDGVADSDGVIRPARTWSFDCSAPVAIGGPDFTTNQTGDRHYVGNYRGGYSAGILGTDRQRGRIEAYVPEFGNVGQFALPPRTVAAPKFRVPPTIAGQAVFGQTLTFTDPVAAYSSISLREVLRDDAVIATPTAGGYTVALTSADYGARFAYRVTATGPDGRTVVATSAMTVPVHPVENAITTAYASAGTLPPLAFRSAYNTLIQALADDGMLDYIERLRLLGAHDERASLTDVIDPSRVAANIGCTWTRGQGFKGDGVAAYISLASQFGPKYTQDNAFRYACVSEWGSGTAVVNTPLVGVSQGNRSNITTLPDGRARCVVNDATVGTTSAADLTKRHFMGGRFNAASKRLWVNGATANDTAAPSTPVSLGVPYLLRDGGVYSDERLVLYAQGNLPADANAFALRLYQLGEQHRVAVAAL